MGRRIATAELNAETIARLGHTDRENIYNGLDCCITFEVYERISEDLSILNTPHQKLIYDFERGMQAPALEIMRRGFLVDEYERRIYLEGLENKIERFERILNKFAGVLWGKGLNANSPQQLKEFFFFHENGLKLPPVELSFKGVRRVTTNREALEKLATYFYAVPFINCILAIRDAKKERSLLRTEISPDGRFRTSYGVAATTTGRWNSSSDAFGEGSNLQNISVKLRKVFIADKGKKLGHLDLEQAESKIVGLLVWLTVGDESYLLACESGDLHTYVAKILWPGSVVDKHSAEQLFYRHFSYRDMSKRGGHASNYRVTPYTMSRHLKIATELAANFQVSYFGSFPGIPLWHAWTSREIGINQNLITPLGRSRDFFGRPDDDATLREAIAFIPQSTVADLLNVILWKVWRHFRPYGVELLTQEHDGFTFQFPDNDAGLELAISDALLEAARIPITVSNNKGQSRTLIIPADLAYGWNWAPGDKPPFWDRDKNCSLNPNGLMKWRGKNDGRKRLEGLDRLVA